MTSNIASNVSDGLAIAGTQADAPVSKRPRLSMDEPPKDHTSTRLLSAVAQIVSKKLTGDDADGFASLSNFTLAYFNTLSENDQYEAVRCLGTASCQVSCGTMLQVCEFCDKSTICRSPSINPAALSAIVEIVTTLQSSLKPGYRVRAAVLEVHRRILIHKSPSECLDVASSPTGQFCLAELRSSVRDHRLRALRLLQLFVIGESNHQSSIIRINRQAILEVLKSMWETDQEVNQETAVMGLARIAAVSSDEELNAILLQLVGYLGHMNAYITSLIAVELVQLAQAMHTNLQGLFRPFWRTLSVVIAKHLEPRPAVAQLVCELLGMNITGLLHLIEDGAVPYLVVSDQLHILLSLSGSNGTPIEAIELCMRSMVSSKVYALLLAQNYTEPEKQILHLLGKVSSNFPERDLTYWLSIDTSRIACELLKIVSDGSSGKKSTGSKAIRGLQFFSQLMLRKQTSSSSIRRSDALPAYLERTGWEIVTILLSEFDDSAAREMVVERRRCLRALGLISQLGQGRANFALPSICACLRSAVDDGALCNVAYVSWANMLSSLDDRDASELLGQTCAITIKYWSSFDPETKGVAFNMFTKLLNDRKDLVKTWVNTLPSLQSVPELATIEKGLSDLRTKTDDTNELSNFIYRLRQETAIVVEFAMSELANWLNKKAHFVQSSLMREQPDSQFAELIRVVLDNAIKFSNDSEIVLYAAQCLGAIGRVDTSRLESVRDRYPMTVLTNFATTTETHEFLMYILEHILVKEYLSASSLRKKTFLGWSLQECLKLCEITSDVAANARPSSNSGPDRHWKNLAEETRLVLAPFLTSKFIAPGIRPSPNTDYPVYNPATSYDAWLTGLTLDLLTKGIGSNIGPVFEVCWKLVHFSRSVAVAAFLMPYAATNLVLTGTPDEIAKFRGEILYVLNYPYRELDVNAREVLSKCSQGIFDILNYMSAWLQEKRKWVGVASNRAERGIRDLLLEGAELRIEAVDSLVRAIQPETITQRSIECKSFARALLHWEQYIHAKQDPSDEDYRRLQDIYAQIDEPDGIEGISSCMHVLNADSQVLEHVKNDRWLAAQNWYDMRLTESPDDTEVQWNLLYSLKASGQYDVLLHRFSGITARTDVQDTRLFSLAAESAWATGQFGLLQCLVQKMQNSNDFSMELGTHLAALNNHSPGGCSSSSEDLWLASVRELTFSSTSTLAACSDTLLRAHAVDDLFSISRCNTETKVNVLEALSRRLDVLGTDLYAKQYVLNIHRAAMLTKNDVFDKNDLADSWLTTSKLARKARLLNQAFDAVLRASSLGSRSAVLEHAKLLWLEGRHRKAIKTLEQAMASGAFNESAYLSHADPSVSRAQTQVQNDMLAKANILLGKWRDQAGQAKSEDIIKTFQQSTQHSKMWERGWYHLGKHYMRILDSERQKPIEKQSQTYLMGGVAQSVCDNYLRALAVGSKSLFQSLPKVITLWLELMTHPELEHNSTRGNTEFHKHLNNNRRQNAAEVYGRLKRYVEKMPAWYFYTILPQLVSCITHPAQQVFDVLQQILVKVIGTYPHQATWTLLAMTKSVDKTRSSRGEIIVKHLIRPSGKKNAPKSEFGKLYVASRTLADELLRVADYTIESKITRISLARDLGFNHKIAPCKLVVPAESCLIPNAPTAADHATSKTFRPFSKDPTTIENFSDEAIVLSSLQKPRKLTMRGSDGHLYAILAKPKDDLRKDQRLMEFDTMINRFLKRDIDASKRGLYIRTYAVVPLNEECGVIEWVDNLKTMRDILLKFYRERNIVVDYSKLRGVLDEICVNSKDPARDFTEKVLVLFPPVLRIWFVEAFPDPGTWFTARLRYTRSIAVMSMVGHILGLGDRHGENILFEEGNGGIMHVDFNCLFDKGLTFEKPEVVPFRLTHNMVDAFGTFGVEGPFRRSSEITMQLLRNHEDALITVMETFLHDPTADFQTSGKKRKAKDLEGIVPDTPEKMLETVKGKVRGMLQGESLPLSVGGYVDLLIRRATDRSKLTRMYIGWCAFL